MTTFLEALRQCAVKALTDPFGIVEKRERKNALIQHLSLICGRSPEDVENALQRILTVSQRGLYRYDHYKQAFTQLVCMYGDLDEAVRVIETANPGMSPAYIIERERMIRRFRHDLEEGVVL